MPIVEYQCKNNHITEVIHLNRANITEKAKCATCNKEAEKIFPTGGGFNAEMLFGEKYGFSSPSDRKAWWKNNDVMEFTGAEKR